ncbi:RNA-directed DNA polymerase, eukaryota [Tanacetum coccineum]|uniref:RNA-directed DNA polymerase, eukaryota n=1 Tax=Tanacetum coccineum TaxID=301880 RepID=A0ABQ4Z656_9ASTR
MIVGLATLCSSICSPVYLPIETIKTFLFADIVSCVCSLNYCILSACPVRGGLEAQQLDHLMGLIESTLLSNSDDRWVWDLNGDGVFRVKDALQVRLPTRSNLVRRNILIDSLSFPICDGEPEDSFHLFFRCCLARDVTRLVCRWWDLDFHSFNSYTDWQAAYYAGVVVKMEDAPPECAGKSCCPP